MQLISTHFVKTGNVGYHGNLFGGTLLSWLDEAGAAFAAEKCGSPRMVTVKIAEVIFKKPCRPGQIIKIYGQLEARRHSPYNGSQKIVCITDMTFVRIDGDGEPVPIDELIKKRFLDEIGETSFQIQLQSND